VDHAIAVTKSNPAKAAHDRYDLTVDQAAAVAEFEDDQDAVKALVAAATAGSTTCSPPPAAASRGAVRADVERVTATPGTVVVLPVAPAEGRLGFGELRRSCGDVPPLRRPSTRRRGRGRAVTRIAGVSSGPGDVVVADLHLQGGGQQRQGAVQQGEILQRECEP
jgi:hypothetical protein